MRVACIILFGLAPTLAVAQDGRLQAANRFVTSLYDAYQLPGSPSSLDPARERRIFSPALLAGVRHDRPASSEIGKLDHDPICDCQDPEGLKIAAIDVAPSANGRAIARVRLTLDGDIYPVTLTLVDTRSGWRVDDVGTRSTASLRRFLKLPQDR